MSTHEKKTLENLAVGAGYGLSFGLVGFALMFFFRVVVAKYFGAERFGQYTLVETILKILFIVVLFGIHSGITRYVPIYLIEKNFKKLKGYLTFVFGVPLALSVLASLAVIFFADTILSFFNLTYDLKIGLILIALALPFKVVTSGLRKLFVARKKVFPRELSYHVIEKGSLLLGTLVVIFFELTLKELFFVLFLSAFIPFVHIIFAHIKNAKLPLNHGSEYRFRSWLNFSIPLFFTAMFAYFIGWSDNLILAKYLSFDDLGIYAIGFSLAGLMNFIQLSFSPIFVPLISEAKSKKKAIYPTFKKATAWIIGFTLVVFAFMIFFPSELLHVLFGKEFIAAGPAVVILLLGMLLFSATGLSSTILLLHKQTWFIFKANVFFAVTNIVLNLLLIPVLGIVGSAIASAISVGGINIALFWKASQHEKLGFDMKYVGKFLAASLVAAGVSKLLFVVFFNPTLIQVGVIGVAYLILVLMLLYVFKPFDRGDIQIIELIETKFKINLNRIKSMFSHS